LSRGLRRRRRRALRPRAAQHDRRSARLGREHRPRRTAIDDGREDRRERTARIRYRPVHERVCSDERDPNPGPRLEPGAAHGGGVTMLQRQACAAAARRAGARQTARRCPGHPRKQEQGQKHSESTRLLSTQTCAHVVPPAVSLAR